MHLGKLWKLLRKIPPRLALSLAGMIAVGLALWCLWLWQPERQVRLHTENLFARASKRNWDNVGTMIADDYADKWNLEKTFVLREMRELFRHFFSLEIAAETPLLIAISPRSGTATTTIRVRGGGTQIAEFVKSEVNRINAPFTLRWERRTAKPWHWVLANVDHPDFNPRAHRAF